MKLSRIVATYFFIVCAYAVSAQSIWSQVGADIEGGAGDGLGTTLSMSADGTIIAAGAPSADAGSASSLRGLVKVYMLEGGSWTQMGSTINGTENGAAFGAAISISDDGTLLAIGAPYSASSFGEFSNSGQVKIYSWNAGSSDWILEETIEAEAAGDNFGYAVSISGDGSVIAAGAPFNDAGGDSRGTVSVYSWDGASLTVREDLDGAADFDSFGTAVSLNFDGSVLAVGAPSKSGSGGELNVGQVTTYSWNTTTYSNTGTLDGVAEFDTFGDELSLSDDGTRLAVSTTKFLGGTTYVELFDFSTSWSSIGVISSANDSDGFGNSISLSGDGSHVAIGASSNVTGSVGGRAEVYAYSGAAWEKVDTDIVGEAENDGAGTAVAISAEGAFVAVGAPNNVAGGINAGQVKVFGLAAPDITAPSVAITSGESNYTQSSPFGITITFSEEVTGFVIGDIAVANGSAGNFVTADNTTFTADITPAADGTVTVNIAADVAQDLGGNANLAATEFNIVYDVTAPTVGIDAITTNDQTPALTGTIDDNTAAVSVAVGEAMYEATNNGDGTWTLADNTLPELAEGGYTITVSATDEAGNQSEDASAQLTIDLTGPQVFFFDDNLGQFTVPVNEQPLRVYFTFSEPVTSVTVDDIIVEGNAGTAELLYVEAEMYYTLTIPLLDPATDQSVTVTMPEGSVQDLAGNGNAAASITVAFDATSPSVTVNALSTNDQTPALTGTIDDNAAAINVTVGEQTHAATNNGDGTWTLADNTLSALADGTYDVVVSATDASGNVGTDDTIDELVIDLTAPIIAVDELSTNDQTPALTGTIDDNAASINVTVGEQTHTATNNGDGTWTLADNTLSSLAEAEYTVSAVATDALGNQSEEATALLTIDLTGPQILFDNANLDGLASFTDPVNISPLIVNIFFTEEATGLTLGEITIDGNVGTTGLSEAQESGVNFYMLAVPLQDPNIDQQITITIPAGAAEDAAGNPNAEGSVTISYDVTGPSVNSISTIGYSTTNVSPIAVEIVFSEEITELTADDFTLGNGTIAAAPSSDDNITFTLDITPADEGLVTIQLLTDVVEDLAGNTNTLGTGVLEMTYDVTAPDVEITTESENTASSPIVATVTFSEVIDEVTTGNFTITNGTATSISAVDAGIYTLEVTPNAPAEGSTSTSGIEVTIALEAGKVQDAAGNGNTASNSLTVNFDDQAPVFNIFNDSNEPLTAVSGNFTANFIITESASVFDIEDINVTNGTKSNFRSESVFGVTRYRVDIALTGSEGVTITIPAGAVTDAAGNANIETTFSIGVDNTGPTVTISSSASSPTNTNPIPVTFAFSEKVAGFAIVDIVANNFAVTSTPASEDNITFTTEISPSANGELTIALKEASVQDIAGNSLTNTGSLSITFDDTAPTVAISGPDGVNSTEAFQLTFTFSENVEGFTIDDIAVTNGTRANFSGSDAVYAVAITPSGAGTVTVSVAENAATDAAGNQNAASAQKSVSFDNTRPTVAITGTPTADLYSKDPISFTFTFSEPVENFTLNSISVVNASATELTDNNPVFTAKVTPVTLGTISVSIAENAVTDGAGNGNTSATVTFEYLQKYSGGTGTETDPYLIAKKEDLKYLSENSADWSSYFKQTADISFTGDDFISGGSFYNNGRGFIPIGNWGGNFNGSYDGDGKIIEGLVINDYPNSLLNGLFGYLYAGSSIKNIVLKDVDIKGRTTTGAIAGYNFGTITNCSATGSVKGGGVSGVGGLIGNNFGEVTNCYAKIKVSGEKNVGGLIGASYRVNVSNSYSEGEVSGTSEVGGLIGYFDGGTLSNSYATGVVTGNGNNIGGLIGVTGRDGNVASCFATCIVSGADNVGGLMGDNSGSVTNCYATGHVSGGRGVGGLIGSHVAPMVNCYATATVSGTESVGGLTGIEWQASRLSFTNTLWDTDLSGTNTNKQPGPAGLGTIDMRKRETYVNASWDLTDTWFFVGTGYHPILKWQIGVAKPFTVSGKVVDKDGNPFSNGKAEAHFLNAPMVSVDLAADGSFTLENIPAFIHSIVVVPADNETAHVKTYYGNTDRSALSRHVYHPMYGIEIKMISKTDPNLLTGNGVVNGRVVRSASGGRIVQGRILEGEGLEGVTVFLVRVSDGEIMTSVETDVDGKFEIAGIPAGEYQLLLDVVGIDVNLEGSTFTMDEEGTPLTISAAVSEEGISFAIEEVLGVEDEIALSIYPNPAENQVNVLGKGKLTIRLLSLSGHTLAEKQFVDQTAVDLSTIPHGVYLLEIVNDSQQRTVKRLMKSN